MNAEDSALVWLNSPFVKEEDKNLILEMKRKDPKRFEENFSQSLEMGTGGLRAVMDMGPGKINPYTIAQATQALVNYLKKHQKSKIYTVIIGYDARLHSKEFAETASEVLSANDVNVYISHEPIPTPYVSFFVRHLKASAGIMITASHNPKEYNGFKIFDKTGAQPIAPGDEEIIESYKKITSFDQIKFKANPSLIKAPPENLFNAYYQKLEDLILNKELIQAPNTPKMLYTSFHGVGSYVIPKALKKVGYKNLLLFEEQSTPDGNFPTISSPNPEEDESFEKAICFAKRNNADFILATDPDVDRLRIGVRHSESFVLLDGNQIGAVLLQYLLETRPLPQKPYVITTIVTSPIIKLICQKHKIECIEVLTGFKYIGDKINEKGEENFLFACEESCGYLVSPITRDKDAVSGAVLITELAGYLKKKGISFLDYLIEIYKNYGFYFSSLKTLTKKSPKEIEEMKSYLQNLRENPPKIFLKESLEQIDDYETGFGTKIGKNGKNLLNLPSSNVLTLSYNRGTRVIIRPSGTEPKIKFYFTLSMEYQKSLDYTQNIKQGSDAIKRLEKLFFT